MQDADKVMKAVQDCGLSSVMSGRLREALAIVIFDLS